MTGDIKRWQRAMKIVMSIAMDKAMHKKLKEN